jgi:hypothetical protein
VSLLIGELAFGLGSDRDDHVKVAVLTGSLAAALLATIILRLRNRTYRRIYDAETADENRDDIPDVYQQEADVPSRTGQTISTTTGSSVQPGEPDDQDPASGSRWPEAGSQ